MGAVVGMMRTHEARDGGRVQPPRSRAPPRPHTLSPPSLTWRPGWAAPRPTPTRGGVCPKVPCCSACCRVGDGGERRGEARDTSTSACPHSSSGGGSNSSRRWSSAHRVRSSGNEPLRPQSAGARVRRAMRGGRLRGGRLRGGRCAAGAPHPAAGEQERRAPRSRTQGSPLGLSPGSVPPSGLLEAVRKRREGMPTVGVPHDSGSPPLRRFPSR